MKHTAIALLAVLLAGSAFAQTVPQRRVGATVSNLTNVPQTLIPALPVRTVQFCVLIGGAAQKDVVFRAVDNSPVYTTITLGAGETKVIQVNTPITEEGLEVGTSTAAGDVTVTCVYSVGP